MGSNTSITHTSPTLMFERKHYPHRKAHSIPPSNRNGKLRKYRKDIVSSNASKFNNQFDNLVEQVPQQYIHRSNDDLIFSNRKKSVNGHSRTLQEKPSPAVNTSIAMSKDSSIRSIHNHERYTPILPFTLPKVESDSSFIILHAPRTSSSPSTSIETHSHTNLSSPQKSVSPPKLPKINLESFETKKSNSNRSNSLKERQSSKISKPSGTGSEDDLVNIDMKISSKINRFSLQQQLISNDHFITPVNSSVTIDELNLFSSNRKDVQNCNSQTFPNNCPPLHENLGNDEIFISITPPPCIADLSHLNVSHCKLRMLSNERSNKRKMLTMNRRESMFSSTTKPIVLR